jgi:hypothetical protein
MVCVTDDFGDRDPGFGNPAMDEGKDGSWQASGSWGSWGSFTCGRISTLIRQAHASHVVGS